jgi:hypothetical protein
MYPHSIENAFIKFSGNCVYSRHGDTVSLYADRIDNLSNSCITSGSLALQLWACQAPYNGGNLTGWKLAELKLGILEANHFIASVTSDVPANFPEHGDHAIVLVIAEWNGEDFNLIHDFRNFPNRDVFLHPRIEGLVGYRCIDNSLLAIDVERIHNPRDPNNLSGTLSIELWALSEPYVVGDFAGHALAGVTLGALPGTESWHNCSYDLEIRQPTPGIYTLVMMLREWTGNGYVTRDHSNFSNRVTFPLVTPIRPFPESSIGNNADEKVRHGAQAPGAATVAGQPGIAQTGETISVSMLLANIKCITQWMLEKIKQQLTILR